MIQAAGILFQAPDGRVLLVRRSAEGAAAGMWALPGGKLEDGESAQEAANREAREELGVNPMAIDGAGALALLTRRQKDGVDWSTFHQMVPAPFEPTLNEEHDEFLWADPAAPPAPLHPGCAVVLARAGMNELDVARAIAAGELTSPQLYENMALVAMRITGTGVAYRSGLDEFVWRNPEIYLNDDFLARCNGLPVIVEHPKGNALTSQEFADRIVGTILLSYIKSDEVWGVAKIFDQTTIDMVNTHQLSTSPAVVFRQPGTNTKKTLEDGSTLLIEGKPSLLDHLAICEQGVWDKGRPPAGVASTLSNGGTEVADKTDDETKQTEADTKGKADADPAAPAMANADAEAGDKLDRILAHVDSIGARLDALERGGGGAGEGDPAASGSAGAVDPTMAQDGDYPPEIASMPRETAADRVRFDMACAGWKADQKARADAAAAEEQKAKAAMADRQRMDSDLAATRTRIEELEKRLPTAAGDADPAAMADAQARADAVYAMHGAQAPRALVGESLLEYRRRLAKGVQAHSPMWRSIDLGSLPEAALDVAAATIYADAVTAARNPVDLPEGQLRPVVTRDATGRQITSFYGEPAAWMRDFTSTRRRLVGINNGSR